MATPSAPQNLYVQTQNRQILISWDLSVGATSYVVQRSLDNITFTTITTLSGSPLQTSYLDVSPLIGVKYSYQVAALNGANQSIYTPSQSAIAAPTSEMSLAQLRLMSQQKADRVNSNFVTLPEWNTFINLAMYELYDLLVTLYEDQYVASPAQFTADGVTFLYALPDGATMFANGINPQAPAFAAPSFYKLLGVDLALQSATNAYVTISKFNFIDRNRFVYPNTSSTIYGVFNLQYRLLGTNIEFIPTPSAGQAIRLWYVPRLKALLQETDITTLGVSGWLNYVIVRAAKYALDKEESDTTKLDQEILFLQERITTAAANRDAGMPDKISATRSSSGTGFGDGGWNGPIGGF